MAPIQELMKKKLVFGAWCVDVEEVLDEERCRRIKESGLDFGYIWIKQDHSDMLPVLDACQRNDLLVIPFDPRVQNMYADQTFRMKSAVEDYMDHPALAAFALRDEPGVDDFPRLKKMTEACLKIAPDKMPAVNLYPNYASENQLGCATYEEYIDRYADELALDTISYDFYPLYGTPDGETWLQDNYLRNFEVVARACKRKGCDMWYFIQTLAFNHILRDPKEEDIRWQVYCAMSFGAKVIQLFTYCTPENTDEIFEESMIDRAGNTTARYGYVQNVIREMNRFTEHYVPYSWEGAMTNCNGLTARERSIDVVFPGYSHRVNLKGSYMDLDHPLTEFTPVKAFEGEYPLLMGCFTKGEKKAFTLVNMEDPGRRRANKACITFDEPKTLMVHGKDGSQQIETGASWSVDLACGEGLFVEIL